MKNKRWSEILHDQSHSPSASGIAVLRKRLRLFVSNIRRRLGTGRNDERLIATSDILQQEVEFIDDTIVDLMNKYRQKLMSSHVTERAAYRVLNELRTWVRRQYAELSRTEFVGDEEVEAFSPAVFRMSTEDKVEDFERLHALGVIDMVEYYFLFAAYHQYKNAEASRLIGMKDETGRQILGRARDRVQAYLEQIEEGDLLPPKIAQEKRIPREIDMDLLMSAFRQILGNSF